MRAVGRSPAAGSRSARTRGGGGGRRAGGGGGPAALEWDQAHPLALNGVDALGPGPKPTAAQCDPFSPSGSDTLADARPPLIHARAHVIT